MRHLRQRNKLGVTTKHRKALLRNMVRNLVIHKKIRTTLAKAKATRSFADNVIELAKRGDLHARRLLISKLGCSKTAHTLIKEIAPHFKNRKGGYTRVLQLHPRSGDASNMALLEFTETIESPEKKKAKKKTKKKSSKQTGETKTDKAQSEKPKKATKKKAETTEPTEEKQESQKKGGFLSTLRKFLKGDEESR